LTPIAIWVLSTLLAQDPVGWQAEAAEESGDIVRAWTLYSQAAALNPGNRRYASKAALLREAALDKSKVTISVDEVPQAPIDPSVIRPFTDEEKSEIARLRPPPRPALTSGKFAFSFRGAAREILSGVAGQCGVDAVFDNDFPASAGPIRFQLDSATCPEAMHAAELVTGAFSSPISERVLYFARDTQDKRRDHDRTAAVTIHLPEPITPQEAQEAARGVQQLFDIQKFAIDNTQRLVLFRDRASKVLPAQALFEQLMTRRPQVMIEAEFIQVNQQRDQNYGLDLPALWRIANLRGQYMTLAGGPLVFGLSVADAAVVASMTRSQVRTLQRSTLRSLDSQAANLHVGDKFPILISGFFGDTGADPSQPVFRPPPQIQFEDLGLTLKVTPRVHGTDEITLNVESEFKVLTGQASNGIPVISNRKYLGQARLKSGEWAIVAGLTSILDSRSFTGIAGLSQIPLFGVALRNNATSKTRGDIVLLLKPTIVDPGPADAMTRAIWAGSETRPAPLF
jgi:general secretion pathway protein D